jgi:predicted transcriptional regulator
MARINISADMWSLVQRVKKEGFITKKYVMDTPYVSKTCKALLKHGFIEGIGSDHRTYELTDLGRQLSELEPRFSGNSFIHGDQPNDSWIVVVDNGKVSNPKPRVDMRKDYRKTYPITDLRTLQETQDEQEKTGGLKFISKLLQKRLA